MTSARDARAVRDDDDARAKKNTHAFFDSIHTSRAGHHRHAARILEDRSRVVGDSFDSITHRIVVCVIPIGACACACA